MATSETAFQSELVDALKNRGMHAFKASHREKTGVVDIYVRTKPAGIWAECKWMTVETNFRTEKVSLTRPQWAFMRDELDAGGTCAKIIGYRRKTQGHDIHGLFLCHPHLQHTQVMRAWLDDNKHPAHIVKVRGANWPAELIVNRIVLMNNDQVPWAHQEREG
jgi:Holliday junction resolvase